MNLLPPGDVFGAVIALDDRESAYTARAQVSSSVLKIKRDRLQELLEEHPSLYKEFTEYLTERVEESHTLARRLAHDKVEVRIAASLVALLSEFAKLQSDSDKSIYVIEMTRLQLADLTGTTPETAIRATKKLEREGILDLTVAGEIKIIDADSLEEMIVD